jgi:hypothetical protein
VVGDDVPSLRPAQPGDQAIAAARGVPLELSVLDGNRARELYLRLGFVVTRVVPPRTRMAWIAPAVDVGYGEPLADPVA